MRLCYTEGMKGGLSKASPGFTIIETLIVLGVTGLILTSALLLVGGRQARTQFNVGIGQIQQQIEQAISEVKNGYYPNKGDIKCTTTGVGSPILTKIGPNGQGANSGCILLGKAIQFYPAGAPQNFVLIPITGNRQLAGKEVTSIASSKPIAIAPISASDTTTPNATETRTLPNQITVVGMWQGSNTANKLGAVAILFSLASYNAYSGLLDSGSLQVSLYAVATTQVNQNIWQVGSAIQGLAGSPGANLQPVDTVRVCLASGTTNQSGLLTIGGSTGESLSVTMDVKDGKTCGLSL